MGAYPRAQTQTWCPRTTGTEEYGGAVRSLGKAGARVDVSAQVLALVFVPLPVRNTPVAILKFIL